MLELGAIVLGVDDVPRAVAFWTRALGYVERYPAEPGWASLRPADGGGPNLSLMRSDTPAQPYPRVHLDLYAGDTAGQAREIDRLIGLGARHVDWDRYPADADFVVLADPDGNRFCVIDTGR